MRVGFGPRKPAAARRDAPSLGADRRAVGSAAVSAFTFPNRILFGTGASKLLADELSRLSLSRPLVVTDAGLIASGLVGQVVGFLGRQAVVFSDIQSNPGEEEVLAGLDRYRDARCDGVIGLGGGSPIDAAKAIRLMVTHPGRLADYDLTRGGQDKIKPLMPPMIAVPTTAGTGSEAGRGTLIQLPQTGRKTIALSPYLLPSTAICDPDLTRDLPPELTAGTGMDAFTHCVESYLSTTFHPMCDGIAVEGLRYISKGLETAVRDGFDADARSAMMMGALLGGISFHKGLGVVHALSHALGCDGSCAPWHVERNPSAAWASLQSRGRRSADGRPGGAFGAGSWWGCRRTPDHVDGAGSGSHASSPPPGSSSRGLNATASPNTPGWQCSTTATAPIRALVPKPTWKTCSIGPGDEMSSWQLH